MSECDDDIDDAFSTIDMMDDDDPSPLPSPNIPQTNHSCQHKSWRNEGHAKRIAHKGLRKREGYQCFKGRDQVSLAAILILSLKV